VNSEFVDVEMIRLDTLANTAERRRTRR